MDRGAGNASDRAQVVLVESLAPGPILSDLADARQAHRVPYDVMIDRLQIADERRRRNPDEPRYPVERALRIPGQVLVVEPHPVPRGEQVTDAIRVNVVVPPLARGR